MSGYPIRLIAVDLDGVLVPIKSSWEFLHRKFGVESEASRIKEMFVRGEISYDEWMRLDTSLWIRASGGKLPKKRLVELLEEIPLNPGSRELVRTARRIGAEIAIISGGIDLLASKVARELGISIWLSNRLIFNERGYLVAGGRAEVGADKAGALTRLAQTLNVDLSHVIYIGDSEWDAPAMEISGFSIAFGEADQAVLERAVCHANSLYDVARIIEELRGGSLGVLRRFCFLNKLYERLSILSRG